MSPTPILITVQIVYAATPITFNTTASTPRIPLSSACSCVMANNSHSRELTMVTIKSDIVESDCFRQAAFKAPVLDY